LQALGAKKTDGSAACRTTVPEMRLGLSPGEMALSLPFQDSMQNSCCRPDEGYSRRVLLTEGTKNGSRQSGPCGRVILLCETKSQSVPTFSATQETLLPSVAS
jgi:hypothetical protein